MTVTRIIGSGFEPNERRYTVRTGINGKNLAEESISDFFPRRCHGRLRRRERFKPRLLADSARDSIP